MINSIQNYKINQLPIHKNQSSIAFKGEYKNTYTYPYTTHRDKKHKTPLWVKLTIPIAILTGGGGVFTTCTQAGRTMSKNIISYTTWDNVDDIYKNKIAQNPVFSLVDLALREHEGIYPIQYQDRKGIKTIAIGHVVSKNGIDYDLTEAQKRTKFDKISTSSQYFLSPNQIAMLYYSDLLTTYAQVKYLFSNSLQDYPPSKISWENLSNNKKAALILLAFQVGANKIAYTKTGVPTKLLTNARAGNFDAALKEFNYSTSIYNDRKRRYIEMYLWSNGQASTKTILDVLYSTKKWSNAKKLQELTRIKEEVAPIIADIQQKLNIQN